MSRKIGSAKNESKCTHRFHSPFIREEFESGDTLRKGENCACYHTEISSAQREPRIGAFHAGMHATLPSNSMRIEAIAGDDRTWGDQALVPILARGKLPCGWLRQSRILFFEHLNSPNSLAIDRSGLHVQIETLQTTALSNQQRSPKESLLLCSPNL
jgi:hypothetical protein